MSYAKSLLFVDDDKSKLWQLNVIRQNAMSSDHHVGISFFAAFNCGLLFLLRTKAGKQIDLCRKRSKALCETLKMLISQDGRWSQHSDLAAIHHCFERRSHRNLRIVITDCA